MSTEALKKHLREAGAVTSAKIANDVIIHTKIADIQVRSEHLDGNAVETGAIKDDAVTSAKLAALSTLAVTSMFTPSIMGGYAPYADDGTVYVDNNGFLKVKGVTGA
eukprot:SAG22_NODE_1219_length_5132_cov_2.957878_7_plen_107_part_00